MQRAPVQVKGLGLSSYGKRLLNSVEITLTQGERLAGKPSDDLGQP